MDHGAFEPHGPRSHSSPKAVLATYPRAGQDVCGILDREPPAEAKQPEIVVNFWRLESLFFLFGNMLIPMVNMDRSDFVRDINNHHPPLSSLPRKPTIPMQSAEGKWRDVPI